MDIGATFLLQTVQVDYGGPSAMMFFDALHNLQTKGNIVQLKKKAKTWKCVLCHSKQEVMKIYFKGTTKDCRINVQNINMQENNKENEMIFENELSNTISDDSNEQHVDDTEYEDDGCFDGTIDQELSDLEVSFEEGNDKHEHDSNASECFLTVDNHGINPNKRLNDIVDSFTNNSSQNEARNNFSIDSSLNAVGYMHNNIFESNCDVDDTLDF